MDHLFRKRTVSENKQKHVESRKAYSTNSFLALNLVRPSSAYQKVLPIHDWVYSLKNIVREPI